MQVITRTPAPQVIREANLSERPSPDEPLQSLRVVVGSSLRQALEKRMNELSLTAADSAKGTSNHSPQYTRFVQSQITTHMVQENKTRKQGKLVNKEGLDFSLVQKRVLLTVFCNY